MGVSEKHTKNIAERSILGKGSSDVGVTLDSLETENLENKEMGKVQSLIR